MRPLAKPANLSEASVELTALCDYYSDPTFSTNQRKTAPTNVHFLVELRYEGREASPSLRWQLQVIFIYFKLFVTVSHSTYS